MAAQWPYYMDPNWPVVEFYAASGCRRQLARYSLGLKEWSF